MKKLLVLLLAVILTFSASAAIADLKRGDQGEEVQALQEKLIGVGALAEGEADGKFGKKTEKAVKDFQAFVGLKQTGKAGEGFMDQLDYMVYLLNDPNEPGLSEDEMEEYGILTWCKLSTEEEEGGYCFRHSLMFDLASQMLMSHKSIAGIEKKLLNREIELWLRSIRDMYTEWELSAPRKDRGQIRSERDAFEKAYQENREEWKSSRIVNGALINESLWLELTGTDLCRKIYGKDNP